MLDISEQQVLMGILFEYTQKMGVDMQLVSLSSKNPPASPSSVVDTRRNACVEYR